jgi:hypothetical protein
VDTGPGEAVFAGLGSGVGLAAPPPGLSLGIIVAGSLPTTVFSFTEAGGSTAGGSLVGDGGDVEMAVAGTGEAAGAGLFDVGECNVCEVTEDVDVTAMRPFIGLRKYGGSKKALSLVLHVFHRGFRSKIWVGTERSGEHGLCL